MFIFKTLKVKIIYKYIVVLIVSEKTDTYWEEFNQLK